MFFFAYVRDEFIVCEPQLSQVLAILADLHDPAIAEDVAVWEGNRLVVVVKADGSLVWLCPEFKEAAAQAA